MTGFSKIIVKNKKGMTMVEVVISLTVIGIISIPLFAAFMSSAALMKKTHEQMEINAVTRVVKENVTVSVKYGGGNKIPSYEIDEYGDEIEVVLKGLSEAKNLKVVDSMRRVYDKYKFDVKREKNFGEIINFPDTSEYIVILKENPGGREIQKVRMNINRLD